ncbi:MAG: FAD-dependent oxidoreductase [Spirochaetaceae bacterium]|nr:MAG: FAD-dependent oxidoreductase [Spirochaetaceae bacterium]
MRKLLVPGKCISADQVAFSSLRMIPTRFALGQAAGTAAALALERKVGDIRCVNVTELQRTLSCDGIELDPLKHRPFAPEITDDPDKAL